jgi:hypothetical protein
LVGERSDINIICNNHNDQEHQGDQECQGDWKRENLEMEALLLASLFNFLVFFKREFFRSFLFAKHICIIGPGNSSKENFLVFLLGKVVCHDLRAILYIAWGTFLT